jgi:hypothetical protein
MLFIGEAYHLAFGRGIVPWYHSRAPGESSGSERTASRHAGDERGPLIWAYVSLMEQSLKVMVRLARW